MAGHMSDRQGTPTTRHARDDTSARRRYVEWIVLLGVLLIAVVSLWVSGFIPNGFWKALVTSIGTGLLVSAVFAFIQRTVTGRAERRAQARHLQDVAADLSEEFRAQVANVRADAATHDYPGTDEPNRNFNAELLRDLDGAQFYWFRGYSARYVAARFQEAAAACQVRVILPDPRAAESLDLRLSYINRSGRGEQDDDKVRQQIFEELRIGLVGLFLERREVGSVELVMTRAPSLDRIELFDMGIWVTLFSGEGENSRFPRTVRYQRSSILYKMQISEFTQIRESSYVDRYELTRSMSEAAFREIYETITGESLGENRWDELKQSYRRFKANFLAGIGRNGESNVGVGEDSS